MKQLWSKMFRLMANLSQEKTSARMKYFWSPQLIRCLARFIEKEITSSTSSGGTSSSATNQLDLDFYHSLVRFVKYACELNKCKQLMLENRLLVNMCKFMYRVNKSVCLETDSLLDLNKLELSSSATSSDKPDKSESAMTVADKFVLSKKYETVFKDLIRHYFILLDCWPQPFCIEFYNQIIEGKLVEHLLWVQTAECNNLTSSSTTSGKSAFNYLEYSINFLYRLCYEYDACRAEFGRCGGLSHYITRIESQTSLIIDGDKSSSTKPVPLFEYNRLIDIVCLACKESVNRLRLREQGLLINLIRLQQRVKASMTTLLSHYRIEKTNQSIDATWHNKILVGLCCFAHDQDSMNILLSNGLIDLLLAYLDESMAREKVASGDTTIRSSSTDEIEPPEKLLLFKDLFREDDNRQEGVIIAASSSTTPMASNLLYNRKRKLSIETSSTSSGLINIPNNKKLNTSVSSESFYRLSSSSPPPIFPFNGSYSPKSPPALSTSPNTDSCMSPSSFSMPSSPPQRLTRSSPSFYLQRSPSTSSTDSSWPSPNPSLVTQAANIDFDCMEYSNQIQFSPSIDHDESEELVDEEDIEAAMLAECAKNTQHDSNNKLNKSMSYSMSSLTSSVSSTNMMNIESINQTEACVFYVLSQLSHGEKPSIYLMQQFDSVLNCLLDYLRRVRVRNPRALRILNRLTKNQHCFQSFILCYFPYKIKEKLDKDNEERPTTEETRTGGQEESQIDQEMNVYLSSNKVFFDTTSASFPSFESIQHYLLNNLKSQCILANNHGYVTLVSMIKSSRGSVEERVASTLSSPFILRNSKALYYIMIHLNGVELLLDNILTQSQPQRLNSIICMQRILLFVNFKRDLKQLGEYCSEKRRSVQLLQRTQTISVESNDTVSFVFDDEQDLDANRALLSRKSEYFSNLLTNQSFALSKQIPVSNVKYDIMLIILNVLECATNQSLDLESRRIGFGTAVDLVLACDQYFLIELRDFFIAVIAVEFLTMWTACTCYKLAWYVNSEFLANAVIDLVLASFKDMSLLPDSTGNTSFKTELDKTSQFARSFESLVTDLRQQSVSISSCPQVFCLNVQNEQLIVDSFRQRIKSALGEIIKNGSWKF